MSFSEEVKKICANNKNEFIELNNFLKLNLPILISDGNINELANCIKGIIRCGDTMIFYLLRKYEVSKFNDVVLKAYEVIEEYELYKFNVCNVDYYTFFITFGDSYNLSEKFTNIIRNIKSNEHDFLILAFEAFKVDKDVTTEIFNNMNFTRYLDNEMIYSMQLQYIEERNYEQFINCHIKDILRFSNDWFLLYDSFPKALEARVYLKSLFSKNYRLFVDDADKCSKLFGILKDETIRNELANCVKSLFQGYINNSKWIYDVFSIKALFEDVPELNDFIFEYFNDNKKEIINRMYLDVHKNFWFGDSDKNNAQLIVDVLELIIDDICKDTGILFSDIKRIGHGAYSNVYEIGDKVLKIGKKRTEDKLPDNPYALKPLLYKTFDFKDLNTMYGNDATGHTKSRDLIVIEVCKKVRPLKNDELDTEKLYEFYAKMRDVGIDWQDIKPENLGILETDGVETPWRQKLEPSNENLSITENSYCKENINLKKGDIVLLDRDIYYLTDDEYIKNTSSNPLRFYWDKFRKRYEEEHNNKHK